jgi:hypothetical protein
MAGYAEICAVLKMYLENHPYIKAPSLISNYSTTPQIHLYLGKLKKQSNMVPDEI